MGTTNTTTGSNTSNLQFNPIAQNAYNNMVGSGSNILSGYMNNPFSNSAYTMGAAQSQKGAQQAGANNIAALQQNQLTSGLTGQAGAGWLGAQKAQTGRANQAMSSQANVSNVLAALQRQMSAAGTGLSFSPQLTGQSGNFQQQQTTSGLGTWLPQLMGAGLGALTGGLTSGLGGILGGAGGNVANQSLGGAPSMSSVMNSGGGGLYPGFGGMSGTSMPNLSLLGMGQMPTYGGS